MSQSSPKCARCGEAALGYATIGHKRYCHSDERSCYTEQLRDETWGRSAVRLPADGILRTIEISPNGSVTIQQWEDENG
jgi:hypothetical protein